MPLAPLARLDDLEIESPLRVELGPMIALALIRTADAVYAVIDNCSHEDYPLSEGFVEGDRIECALHGSCFSLRTGEPDTLPATRPVRTFPVTVRDGEVLVDLPLEWAELARGLTENQPNY